MNPLLDVQAAISLAQFIQSSVEMYKAGTLTEKQLSEIWHTVGVNVSNAEKMWKNAGNGQSSPTG